MPKMLAPTKKEIKIKIGPGLSEEDPLIVMFYQATEAEVDLRDDHLHRRVERAWGEDGTFSESLDAVNASKQRAVEAWLTMGGCNAEDHKGDKVFKFKERNGKTRPDYENFDAFFKAWGKLAPEWARAIHTCCLIVNPTWGTAFYDEDAIEVIEGEDSGANEEQ